MLIESIQLEGQLLESAVDRASRACCWRGSIYGSAATIVSTCSEWTVTWYGRQRKDENRVLLYKLVSHIILNHGIYYSIGLILTSTQVNSTDAGRMLKKGEIAEEGGLYIGNRGGRKGGGGRTRGVELVPQGSHTVRRTWKGVAGQRGVGTWIGFWRTQGM